MVENLIPSEMINENDRIAVGVSGGADSMLLIHALLQKQMEVNFYIKVIHINHHLRGEESDNDSRFVQDYCIKNNVDYKVFDVNVKKLKKETKKTLEEAARIARYEAIYSEMKKEKLNKLFLAHHANDQAETILMHIFRGAGVGGASGIRPSDTICRPLLKYSKKRILEICNELGLSYIEDSSNNDNHYTRNYIRNVIIPKIEEVYGDAVNMICLFGEKCNEVQKYVESLVNRNLIIESKDSILVKGDAFNNKNFIIREYLKIAFEKLKIYWDIESKHYSLITELNNLPVNSMLDMPHGITAKKVYEGVKFYKKSVKKIITSEYNFTIGTTHIEGYGDIVAEIVSENDVNYGDGNQYLDYYKISNNAVWRFRKQGDMFAKLGSGSKKLNDYLSDKKIDLELRDYIPVLANGSMIYLVAGYDISDQVKMSSETDKIVKISVIKN